MSSQVVNQHDININISTDNNLSLELTESPPVLENVDVYPLLEDQEITPPSKKVAYNKVIVNKVDNTIDENIKSENIKDGVSILGIEGSLKGLEPIYGLMHFSDSSWTQEELDKIWDQVYNISREAFNGSNITRINFRGHNYNIFEDTFRQAANLEIINIDKDTTFTSDNKIFSFKYIFSNCYNLKEIDLYKIFNSFEVACGTFLSTFSGCKSLEKIDFTDLKITNDIGSITPYQMTYAFSNTFSNCSKLKSIINFPLCYENIAGDKVEYSKDIEYSFIYNIDYLEKLTFRVGDHVCDAAKNNITFIIRLYYAINFNLQESLESIAGLAENTTGYSRTFKYSSTKDFGVLTTKASEISQDTLDKIKELKYTIIVDDVTIVQP